MTSDPQLPPEPPPVEPRPVEEVTSPQPKVPFTKTAAAWWALIVGVVILIVLLIFIAQNPDSITIDFLGWTWNAPTGIAFLVAAICGSLITVLAGAARMIQLRRVAKKGLRSSRR